MPPFATRNAATNPDAFAVVDSRSQMTWAEVDDILNRGTNQLLAAEVGPHRRVAVFAENATEVVLAHMAALLAGASSTPVNFHLTADETNYILTDSDAHVLFVGPDTAERAVIAAEGTNVHTIVGWRCDGVDGVLDWDTWIEQGSPAQPPLDLRPIPNLIYTSGTTGQPKGTDLPPTMFAGGDTVEEHLKALAETSLVGLGPHLVVGPMYHTGPLSGMRLLAGGEPLVILGRFNAEATLAAIDHHQAASSIMVPTHFVRLLALPDEVKVKYDVSSMKAIPHTGSKCPIDVKASMIEWFGPVFRDAYGASEVGTVCSISSEEWMDKKGSVGRTVPPFSAVIMDEDLVELPVGTEGRLYFRDETGRGVIYPNDPEKTAASNPEPGLFTLGEIGYVDADGYVFITDRFRDMVVSGGANLYPAEAEQVLIEHPAVADCACIGVPHADLGEELKALIVLEEGAVVELDELARWMRDQLTSMKCPRSYELVGNLLRNTMGKINKRKLRAPYWQ